MTMPTATDHGEAKSATVKLTALERERLKAIASIRGRTPHFIMKEAIQTYLQSAEAEQNFISAGEASWHDYDNTGLHISLDEAKEWAKQLKENRSVTIAPCHT